MIDSTPPHTNTPKASYEGFGKNRHNSLWIDALKRLARNPGSLVGAVILLVIILATIFAPYVTFHDPVGLATGERLQPPNAKYWLGTDAFGRDIYTRIVYGGRISLRVGIIAVTIATLLGVTMGLLAGYYGGVVDTIAMRLIDIMLAFPGILLALAIISVLGPSLFNVMIAVGISATPTYARVSRSSVLQAKEEPFVEAAILIGCRSRRVLLQHILPNVLGPIIVVATLGVAGAIITGAALSFLGLGARPPTPEWGLILSTGRKYLSHAWWIATFPGLAIMITVLSINLVGDGLRDALDPRMKR